EEAYKVEGVFRLPPPAQDGPGIQFRPVPQPPLPVRDPAELGPAQTHGKGTPLAGRVFLPAWLFEDLHSKLVFSSSNEQGGYVLGNVFRQPDSPEKEDDPAFRWFIECTDVIRADEAVGSRDRLLFTGDAWSRVTRRRDKEFPGRRLVAWFHTHLFAADDY